jgi:type II secretory pathway component PulF
MGHSSQHIKEMRRFTSSMRIIGDLIASGKSFLFAIKAASNNQQDKELKQLLNVIGRRIQLGSSMSESMSNVFSPYKIYLQHFVQVVDSIDDTSKAASAINEVMHREYLRELSRSEGSMQKYVTLSMLFSSVVPSFLLFSFTGYSLLGGNSFQGISLLLLLCIAVPFAYGLISFKIGGTYS